MSYLLSLYNDLKARIEPGFDESEVEVDQYRGQLGSVETLEELMGKALRKDLIYLQFEYAELRGVDTTRRIVEETDTVNIIICTANQRSEILAEEDALVLVDAVRTRVQGWFPDATISGVVSASTPWECHRVDLQMSVPGLTVYTVSASITLKRDMDA